MRLSVKVCLCLVLFITLAIHGITYAVLAFSNIRIQTCLKFSLAVIVHTCILIKLSDTFINVIPIGITLVCKYSYL